jgi:transcriptional regulator with XRE-family HTH domain
MYLLKFIVKLKTFSDRLAYARAQAGLTQVQAATKLGISQGRYHPWESGKGGKVIEPPFDILIRISELYMVSIEWLLTGEKPRAEHIAEGQQAYEDLTIKQTSDILEKLSQGRRREVLKYARERLDLESKKDQ